MMIPMLVITVKICGCWMFTTRIRRARMPISTAGTTGVLRFGSTFASRSPAGRLLSRAIANIIRIVAVCTARQQTVTAIATQIKKILPIVLPSTSSTTNCSPPAAMSGELMSLTARIANSRMRPPRMNEATTARKIAFGAVRRGSRVSSPRELAVSKPYIT
jgi:hypothetical protein